MNNKSTTGLVMCTFNGEKYIEEQLKSIQKNIDQIDQIIIVDDNSTDNTIKIISEFYDSNNLDSKIKVISNKINLGWKRNFWEAIKLIKTDYIFLSDQDDIWCPNKAEIMLGIMIDNHDIELLSTNYVNFRDEDSMTFVKSFCEISDYKKYGVSQVLFSSHNFMNIEKPGCTYCFRKTLFDYIQEVYINDYSMAHDALLWIFSILRESCYILNEKLLLHRVFNDSASNPKRFLKNNRFSYSFFIKARYLDLLQNIIQPNIKFLNYLLENKVSENKTKDIKKIYNFYYSRREVFVNKNIFKFVWYLINYKDYYFSFKSLVADAIIICYMHFIGVNE